MRLVIEGIGLHESDKAYLNFRLEDVGVLLRGEMAIKRSAYEDATAKGTLDVLVLGELKNVFAPAEGKEDGAPVYAALKEEINALRKDLDDSVISLSQMIAGGVTA